MKTIIAGSRSIQDREEVFEIIENAPFYDQIECVISGGAKGVDSIGEQWAKENSIPCEMYEAQWDKYGKTAGHIRNGKMAKEGDALIACWDGKSPGTENMIEQAHARNLKVHVGIIDREEKESIFEVLKEE